MLKSIIVVIVVVIVVGAFSAQIWTKMGIWAKTSRLPSVHVQITLKMHVLDVFFILECKYSKRPEEF